MANGDRGPLNKMIQTALVLNAFTVVLLGIGLVLGGVAMRTKLQPQIKKLGDIPRPGPTLDLADQVYNLGEPDRYLKATLVLELNVENKSEKAAALLQEEVKKREAQIRDVIIRITSAKTFAMLNSREGKEKYKAQILKEVNFILSRGEIKNVIFTQFALQ